MVSAVTMILSNFSLLVSGLFPSGDGVRATLCRTMQTFLRQLPAEAGTLCKYCPYRVLSSLSMMPWSRTYLVPSCGAGRGAAPATLATIQNTIQLPWTIFKYKCATSNGRSGDQTDIYWRGEQPCDYPRFCVIILQWMFNILCSK